MNVHAAPAVAAAADLEDTVDTITAIASSVDADREPADLVEAGEHRLAALDQRRPPG